MTPRGLSILNLVTGVAFVGVLCALLLHLAPQGEQRTIFLLTPLTGSYSHKGAEHLRSVLLAAGYGSTDSDFPSRNIRVKAYDSAHNPEALTAWDQLKTEVKRVEDPSNVLAIVGLHRSRTVKALMENWDNRLKITQDIVHLSGATLYDKTMKFTQDVPNNLEVAKSMLRLAQTTDLRKPRYSILRSDSEYALQLATLLGEQISPSDFKFYDIRKSKQTQKGKPRLFDYRVKEKPLGDDPPQSLVVFFCGSSDDGVAYVDALNDWMKKPNDSPTNVVIIGSDGLHTYDFFSAKETAAYLTDQRELDECRHSRILVVSYVRCAEEQAYRAYREQYKETYGCLPDGYGYHSYRAAMRRLARTLTASPRSTGQTSLGQCIAADDNPEEDWLLYVDAADHCRMGP